MQTEIQIKIQKQLRNKIQTLQRIDRITYISICLFSFSIILLLFTCIFIIQNYLIKPEHCRDLTHTIHNITITNPENSIILDTTYFSSEKDYMMELLCGSMIRQKLEKLLRIGIEDFMRSRKLAKDYRSERNAKKVADYEAPSLSPVLARPRP